MSMEIPLSAAYSEPRAFTTVDESDYDYLSQFAWRLHDAGNNQYAIREVAESDDIPGYEVGDHALMHRVIMGLDKGERGKPPEVDHVNGDGLDNRKENLRVVTRAENAQNRSGGQGRTSEYRGVCWDKQTGKWRARFKKDGKVHNLGRYESEEAAARVARRARRKAMPYSEMDKKALEGET